MRPKRKSPGKKRPTGQQSKASRATSGGRAQTKALAIGEAVRREPARRAGFANPLSLLEPLRQSIVDGQIALIGVAMTWSPAHVLVGQHTAFWDGFTAAAAGRSPRQKAAPKRIRAR